MNSNLQRIKAVASSLLVAAMTLFVSCDDVLVADGDGADYSEYITVSNIDPTFNSVTFDIKSEEAVAIAYACVTADGEELDAERVMEAGVKQGVNQGSFTITSLKAETDYKLYVVAQIPSVGLVGPQVKKFTTQVNVGAPSSPKAAGIRAVDIGTSSKTNLTWEVTNGAEVDFSLSMVQPTIVMENVLYEMAKTGVSKEAYLQSFMTTYGYIQVVTEGKGKSQVWSYTDRYLTTPIIPGANYTIYTLAFSGTYADFVADNKDKLEMLEITEVPVTTAEIPRIGNPDLTLKTTERGYIHLRHKVTPNSHAKYWASYFTKTAEFDEFKKLYDEREGAGRGVERLKEFVIHTDAESIVAFDSDISQSAAAEWPITVGWDQDGIDFSRLAIALDDNLVAGDNLHENIDQVRPQDNSTPADFSIEVVDLGSESAFIRAKLGANCAQAFWRAEPKGFFDEALADPELSEALGRKLWDEGYAVHRNYEIPNSYDPATDTFAEYGYDEFWNVFNPKTTYELCAVGLNTTGGISEPKILCTFTTGGISYPLDVEPFITITVPQETVSKTTAVAHYVVEPYKGDDIRETHRVYYHVILEAEDEVVAYDEKAQAEYLFTYGNCWSSVEPEGENSTFNWAALHPSTEYVYLYASLNQKGEMSKVVRCDFKTADNNGGPNPGFEIKLTEEDVIQNSSDSRLYGASYFIQPNGDVKGFRHLFFDEAVLESWDVPVDDDDELVGFFKGRIPSEGLTATDATTNRNYNAPKGKRMWAVADGYGSEETNRILSYVEFVMNVDGSVVIKEQVDIKYEGEPSTILPTSVANVAAATRSAAQAEVERQPINYVAKPVKVINVSDDSAETIRKETGLPVYSMLELSLKTLLRGGEAQ